MSGRDHFASLRVGVTGHITLSQEHLIRAGIEEALSRIALLFPKRKLVVYSALAEGADRIVTRMILQGPGSELVAVLPMDETEYLKDFESDYSKQDFKSLLAKATQRVPLPPQSTRDSAYEAAGEYIVQHGDVLIAVWDGQVPQGRGGTGGVVASARRLKLPIAWIHAGNRKPGTREAISLPDQGQVTFENFPEAPVPPGSVEEEVLKSIRAALRSCDEAAASHKRRRLNFAILASVLGPFAAMTVAINAVYRPTCRLPLLTCSEWLVLAEVVALGFAVLIGVLPLFAGPHEKWLEKRIRAEVLRREQFLCSARAGPYRNAREGELKSTAKIRVAHINDELKGAAELLRETGFQGWSAPIAASPAPTAAAEADIDSQRVESYLNDRLGDQRGWMARKSITHKTTARIWTGLAKFILFAALVIAAVHLGLMHSQGPEHVQAERPVVRFLEFLSILLPVLATAIVGLLSMFGSDRLTRSYSIYAEWLEELEEELMSICSELQKPGLSQMRKQELQNAFQRIVLQTEGLLSAELRQWWLTMHLEVPRSSG